MKLFSRFSRSGVYLFLILAVSFQKYLLIETGEDGIIFPIEIDAPGGAP